MFGCWAKQRTQYYITQLLLLLIFVAVAITTHTVLEPSHTPFFIERDPSLSYPFQSETITDTVLYILVFPTPAGFILMVLLLCKLLKLQSKDWKMLDPIHGIMVYVLAISATVFVTMVMKSYSARLRPNFFALCNYKGYRFAVETGNYTEYLLQTVASVPGNYDYCLETNIDLLDESRSSFPSGHSSLSACAFSFMGLILFNVLSTIDEKLNIFKVPIIILFLFPSIFIALTRTRDYYHNYSDIIGGGIIGLLISLLVYHWGYKAWSENVEKSDDNSYHQY